MHRLMNRNMYKIWKPASVHSRTMKKVMVLPPWMVPYSMLVWSAKSSGDSMGTSILWTVRKAAKLAVYEEIIIKVKAHL